MAPAPAPWARPYFRFHFYFGPYFGPYFRSYFYGHFQPYLFSVGSSYIVGDEEVDNSDTPIMIGSNNEFGNWD